MNNKAHSNYLPTAHIVGVVVVLALFAPITIPLLIAAEVADWYAARGRTF